MQAGQHRDGDRPRRRVRIPGLAHRTVRLRLTALYGVLFFVSGAVLLAISGGFAVIRNSMEASGSSSTGPAPQSAAAKLASANALIRQLRHQLSAQAGTTQSAFSRDLLIASAIALGFMTLGSVAMGWILAGRALRPVRVMTAATQQISAHNLNERLASQQRLRKRGRVRRQRVPGRRRPGSKGTARLCRTRWSRSSSP